MVAELLAAHRKAMDDQGKLLEALEAALAELVSDAAPQPDQALGTADSKVVDLARGSALLPTAGTEVLLCLDPADLERDRFSGMLRYVREASSRSVGIRCICAESMVNVPGGRAHISDLQDAGAEVRVIPLLPFRVLLADHHIVYMQMVGRDGDDMELEVSNPSVSRFVRQIFDYCWVAKSSLKIAKDEGDLGDFSERELIILRMLANGMKDEAMARALGVSTRTLRRVITDVMGKLNVSSRFQLGVRATEYRLLGAPISRG
ncbi:helix-turn-helix domain-containing protein [Streptomyces sp. NPDC038707]|uniref:helix-turn-helix transcriptional regulator n=1 Tax=Streptomyces sp. NPDC038707 TaxID=3154329 RepID=UPI0033E34889